MTESALNTFVVLMAGRNKIFEVLTKKPVVAEEQEQLRNPRSRSAKMRAAERLGSVGREQGSGSKHKR